MSGLALRIAAGVPVGRLYQRDRIIARARSFVGVHETGGSDGRSGNLTPFGQQFGENGVPWCDIFVWCVFNDEGLDPLLYGKFANSGDSLAAFRAHGRTSAYPALGAQVMYGAGGGDHTGIVIGFDTTTITTVEGNWDNQVSLMTRPRTDPYVFEYGYPEYAEGIVSADPNWGGPPPAAPAPAPQPPTTGSGTISPHAVLFDPYTGGGIIDGWIQAACTAAGLPYNAAWRAGYRTLCVRESSYDPNAVNTTDSNAVNPPGYSTASDGHPFQCARGVAQLIPQTFAQYHCPGSSVEIYDPVANIAASMRYVIASYHVSPDGSNLSANVQQADPNRPPRGY